MKPTSLIPAAVAAWCFVIPAHAQQQDQPVNTADTAQPMESVTVSARRFHMEP